MRKRVASQTEGRRRERWKVATRFMGGGGTKWSGGAVGFEKIGAADFEFLKGMKKPRLFGPGL